MYSQTVSNRVKPIDFIDSYIIINKRRFLGVSHFYPFSSGRKSVTSSVFDPPSNVALYTLPICCTLDSNSSCCCSFANVISSVHSPYPRASPVRPRPSSITTEPKYHLLRSQDSLYILYNNEGGSPLTSYSFWSTVEPTVPGPVKHSNSDFTSTAVVGAAVGDARASLASLASLCSVSNSW